MGLPSALVGRDPELAVWSEVLGSLRSGPVGCVLYGAAGIGKTTVLSAAMDAARARGCHVLTAAPDESETALAYAGLADLLAGAPPELLKSLPKPQLAAIQAALYGGEPLPPEIAHRALRVAVLQIVRVLAAESPVVIGIDDTQWIDPTTAKLLEYVLERLDQEPVCLLAALRSDHDELLPFGMEQAFHEDRLVRIGLPGLSLGALQRVLAERVGLVVARTKFRRIAAASAGNPLLALEIALAGPLDGPPPSPYDVEALVAKRLGTMPQATVETLAVVAALARPTVALVRSALPGVADRGLEQAEAAELLQVDDGGRVRFTHPVYATTVLAELSASDRQALHARLAGLVDDVEERARHLAVAFSDRDPLVAAKLAEAAAQAEARGAPEAAAELWELAGLRTPEGQAGLRFGRIGHAGVSIAHAGEPSRARGPLSSAVRRLPAGRGRALARLGLADVSFSQGRTREAVSLCRRALLDAGDDHRLRVIGGIKAGWYGTHHVREQLESVRHAAELLSLWPDEVRDEPALSTCVELVTAQLGFYNGSGLDRVRIERAGAALPPDSLEWPARWARMAWRSLTAHFDLRAARAACAAELELAGVVGDEHWRCAVGGQLAEIDYWLGDWRLAKREAAQAMTVVARPAWPAWPGPPSYVRGLADAHLGDLEAAQQAAKRGIESAAAIDDPWISAAYLGLLGSVELVRQDYAGAVEYFELAEHLVEVIGLAEPARHPFHADQVEAVVGLGDLDRAAGLVEWMEQRVKAAPYAWLSAATHRSQAVLRAATGELEAARDALSCGLRVLEGQGMPFEEGRTQLWLGRVCRRLGDRTAAAAALGTARAIFDRLGAPVWSAFTSED
ncbi:ATP-binding protein [Flindersiella endophytica]